MEWDVTEVSVLSDTTLFVRFRDGVEGTVEFANSFFQGVFEPIKEPNEFKKVMLVDGVVTWEGELDLAPDAMHEAIQKNGVCRLSL